MVSPTLRKGGIAKALGSHGSTIPGQPYLWKWDLEGPGSAPVPSFMSLLLTVLLVRAVGESLAWEEPVCSLQPTAWPWARARP